MPKIFASTLSDHHDQVWSSLVAAVETCLSRMPYDGIRLTDVAREAGIARNTIYNYAPNKRALIVAAIEFAAAPLVAEVSALARARKPAAERLSAVIGAILAWLTGGAHRALIRHAIYATGPDPHDALPLMRDFARQFGRIASDGASEGTFRFDTEITLLLVPGIMQAAATNVFNQPENRVRIEAEVTRVMLAAFSART